MAGAPPGRGRPAWRDLDAPAALPALPPDVGTACYRIAQEALTNVARHARAKNVWVELRWGGREIQLDVRDDGAGFDAGAGGLGLVGMRERAEMLGGRVEVESRRGAARRSGCGSRWGSPGDR